MIREIEGLDDGVNAKCYSTKDLISWHEYSVRSTSYRAVVALVAKVQ